MSEAASCPRPYHHGSLREALLTAAETILQRDGLPGLTLRAMAREAGASHAAPKNHFEDLTGLLSELAAVGYERFSAKMRAAVAPELKPHGRLRALGDAYITFAVENPGLFQLMFRSERLDRARPTLSRAMKEAMDLLADGVRETLPNGLGETPIPVAGKITAAWAVVHGYAMLLLDNRLEQLIAQAPGGETSLREQVLGIE